MTTNDINTKKLYSFSEAVVILKSIMDYDEEDEINFIDDIDEFDEPSGWAIFWDNPTRIRVSMPMDLLEMISNDLERGVDTKKLMLQVEHRESKSNGNPYTLIRIVRIRSLLSVK